MSCLKRSVPGNNDVGGQFLGMPFVIEKGKMETIGCIETILQGILSSTMTSLGKGAALSLVELAGMYCSHKGKSSIILEAVATKDLMIWHAYFGMPRSHNDINVLQRSPAFDDLTNVRAHVVNFTLNGNEYSMGYYLADGIYLDWATLIKSVNSPLGNKRKWFAKRQESCGKDVEQTF
jgi:hypothetical protein